MGPWTRHAFGAAASLLLAAGPSTAGDLRLVDAARQRDAAAVDALLKRRIDVNIAQPDGATALHWAAHWDDMATADALLRRGARVDTANDYGATPLSLACANGSGRMVERLLKAGANARAVVPTGETMLMLAARTGSVEAVSFLMAAGADLQTIEATTGQDALMWATAERHPDVVRLLLERGARAGARSKSGFTPLHFAARTGDIDTAGLLLAAGAGLNETAADGSTPLLVATVRGHTALGSFLLERGADPNVGGFTPLHRAVGSWESELSSRVSEGNEWRVQGGLRGAEKVAFVRALLARGADPNRRVAPGLRGTGEAGSTAFLLAAKAGDAEVMRLLLEHGANPAVATNQNTTPLMAAAGVGRNVFSNVPEARAREAVDLCLQQRDVDVNAVNAAGETALHGAAYIGANSVAEALVKRGANMNVKNKRNWTPLVIAEGVFTAATFQRYPSTAELLLRLGAEPSPPDVYRIGR